MIRILFILLVIATITGCGDGRSLSDLMQVREDLIEENPIIDDAEECILEPPNIYTSLRQVTVDLDLDCLLEVESEALSDDDESQDDDDEDEVESEALSDDDESQDDDDDEDEN